MARLRRFFPKSHGKPRVDDRRVLSGLIFINRTGLRWPDAPKEYGSAKTLYNRRKRWGDMGVFARMMEGLESAALRQSREAFGNEGESVLMRSRRNASHWRHMDPRWKTSQGGSSGGLDHPMEKVPRELGQRLYQG